MRDRYQPVDQRGGERFHPVDRNALGDLRQHLREARKLVLHLPGALPHLGAQQHLPARRQLDRIEQVRHRPLVGDPEFAERFEFVPEEFESNRMRRIRRKHIDDAAAHRELATAGDHVDAGIREVDELRRESRQVVAAGSRSKYERLEAGEVVGERLQGCAHARDHDDVAGRQRRGCRSCLDIRLPFLQSAERVDASTDRFGARAQSLVREGLPGRKLDDLSVRHDARERGAKCLGISAGGDDGKQGSGAGFRSHQPRDERSAEAVGEREICAGGGEPQGVCERGGARKGRN